MKNMELSFNFTTDGLLFLSSFIFFILIIKAWKNKSQNPKKYEKLLPSPPKLPLIGHLHHLIGELPHRALWRLSKKYGPDLHLQIGELSTVVISSRDGARELLKVQDPACADRPENMGFKIMGYGYKDIAFSPYNEYWRQMRKIFVVEMLTAKRIKSFEHIRQQEVSRLIKSIKSSSSIGEAVNLTKLIFSFSGTVTCRAAFGDQWRYADKWLELCSEALAMASGFDLADLFPSSKVLPALSRNTRRLWRIRRELDAILDVFIEEHRLKQDNGEFGGEDIVDVLLRTQKNEQLQFPMDNDNIKAILFDIFAGARDTASTTIDWAMVELIRNPRVMEKVQAEVRQAFKVNKNVDESGIQTLKYLKLVIKETLRMHPPGALTLRACRDECILDGCSIPLKSTVLVNLWAIGRDPKNWDEPENFQPERFINNSIDFLGNDFEFIPFGAGRRMCPGMNFGIANVEVTLAQLLYHFDWKMPQGATRDDLDMTEVSGISISRKDDLYLVPELYNPSTPTD